METALEWVLTNAYKADMISWLSAHPEDFEEAIKLAIADKQPCSWRAAWLTNDEFWYLRFTIYE